MWGTERLNNLKSQSQFNQKVADSYYACLCKTKSNLKGTLTLDASKQLGIWNMYNHPFKNYATVIIEEAHFKSMIHSLVNIVKFLKYLFYIVLFWSFRYLNSRNNNWKHNLVLDIPCKQSYTALTVYRILK